MLANPVVFPVYADPLIWTIAAIASLVEIGVWLVVLRQLGTNVSGLGSRLAVVQILTWVPFLVAVDSIPPDKESAAWIVAALELAVVLVEVPLVLVAARGWFRGPRLPSADMRWTHALLASFAGNLASVAFSLGVALLLVKLLR